MATKRTTSNAFKTLIRDAGQTTPAADPVPSPAPAAKPQARRSRADYTQVAAYVPEKLYTDTRIKLLQEGKGRNFSELVEDLLTTTWRVDYAVGGWVSHLATLGRVDITTLATVTFAPHPRVTRSPQVVTPLT